MTQDQFQEESIDLKKIFFKYLPFWYVFVISIVLALTIAFIFNRISEPVYRTQSTILINDKSKGGMGLGSFMGEMDLFSPRSNLHDQQVILTSWSVVDSTISRMNLDVYYYSTSRVLGLKRKRELFNESPFKVSWNKDVTTELEEPFYIKIIDDYTFELETPESYYGVYFNGQPYRFGDLVEGDGFQFVVQKTPEYDSEQHRDEVFMFIMRDHNVLVDEYVKSTRAEPLNRDAWIIQITYESTHLERSHRYLNTLTDYFIQRGLSEKNKVAQNTLRFIEEQINITTDSLIIAESSLQQFRQDRQLVDVSYLATQLLNELQNLDKQKAIEEVKAQYYDYLLEYLREDKDFREVFGPSALGIDDPLLNNLITEISKLYADRSTLMLSTTERSPQIQVVDQRILQARRSLEENILSIGKASEILLNDLNDRIQKIESRINQLPQTERELINIQRKFNLNDATYNYLLEKRAEAGIAMASNYADNQIIDTSRFKGKVAPRGMLNYAIAIALGFALPMLFFMLRNFLNTRINDKSEVTDALDIPILGVIPHDIKSYKNKDINLVVLDGPKSSIIEAFRAMRINLQFFATGEKHKIISVTSTRSMEGKTFSSINLALVLAMSGKKTIIIGADMRKPKIFKELGIKREPGLSNYLIGERKLEQVIQRPKYEENLFVISSGPVPPNPTELLESYAMDNLLMELKETYDYVIIDTPPAGLVSDALGLLKKADIAIYVIRQGFTQRSALDFIREMKQKIQLDNLVIEINDAQMNNFYGYGGYGFSNNYEVYRESEDEVDPGLLKRWLSSFPKV